MRTRSASVVGRTGKVSLAKKRNVPSTERSARAPMLKPSRMPCFTQVLARHSPAALQRRAELGEGRAVRVREARTGSRDKRLDALTQRHGAVFQGALAPEAA